MVAWTTRVGADMKMIMTSLLSDRSYQPSRGLGIQGFQQSTNNVFRLP
jgi:hypothetical protein